MKNKLALVAAFLAAHSVSMGEIAVTDYLSFKGFADMSYTHLKQEINPVGTVSDNEEENNFRIDEVEISSIFNFEPLTAQLDIEYEEDGDDLEVEQAFVRFDFDDTPEGSAITAGRYASMLGFEAYEPTGLYQYSNAYGGGALSNLLAGAVDQTMASTSSFDSNVPVFFESVFFPIAERYSQGLKYTFEEDRAFLGISIQDSTVSYENRFGGDHDSDSAPVDDDGYGFEIAYAYKCNYGLTFFLGGFYEAGNGTDFKNLTTEDTETYTFNTYTTLELGAWLFAAEFSFSETEIDRVSTLSGLDTQIESVTGLIMANYAYHENASVTARISYMELDSAIEDNSGDFFNADAFKYTAAHNYKLVENVLLIAELSYTEGDYEAAGTEGNLDEFLAAAELLVTF